MVNFKLHPSDPRSYENYLRFDGCLFDKLLAAIELRIKRQNTVMI